MQDKNREAMNEEYVKKEYLKREFVSMAEINNELSFFSGFLAIMNDKYFENFVFMLRIAKYLICHDRHVKLDVKRRVSCMVEIPHGSIRFFMIVGEALKAAGKHLKACPSFLSELLYVASWMKPGGHFPFQLVQRFMSAHGQRLTEGRPHHYVDFYAKVVLLCREAALKKAEKFILKIIKEAYDLIVTHPFPDCEDLYCYCLAHDHILHVHKCEMTLLPYIYRNPDDYDFRLLQGL